MIKQQLRRPQCKRARGGRNHPLKQFTITGNTIVYHGHGTTMYLEVDRQSLAEFKRITRYERHAMKSTHLGRAYKIQKDKATQQGDGLTDDIIMKMARVCLEEQEKSESAKSEKKPKEEADDVMMYDADVEDNVEDNVEGEQ
ncbi:hypothetical protein Daesc_006592 [Daldinia eschscholtzii]|uniref:Uncharacterized protein n=1 Tax=Daldinia eschscholtzii TaxID=292717 RepID=A0AAX6MHZ3_9PEZI